MNGDTLVEVVARTSPDELWQWDYCETCGQPTPKHARFCCPACSRDREVYELHRADPRR